MGFLDFQGRKLAFGLGLTRRQRSDKFVGFCRALYRCYIETDASLVEVNPLVILKDGGVVALDAKMNFDDNALFRHTDIVEYRDVAEEDPPEAKAKEYDLAYISLDGNIGCMVNGAGLAMATMDTIKLVGGEPANFLDVGGGATKEKVTAAFKLILADPEVKAVLVNIFGGIMKCDVIAEGVVAAARRFSSRSRWSSGSRAPTSSWARRSSRSRACRSLPRTTCARPPRRPSPPARGEKASHEHPRQQEHPGALSGHHRLGGLVPRQADARRTARSWSPA